MRHLTDVDYPGVLPSISLLTFNALLQHGRHPSRRAKNFNSGQVQRD